MAQTCLTGILRTVHPWWVDGRLIGYIELGEEIEHITPKLGEQLDAEIILTVNKIHLDRTRWEEGVKMMGKSADWDDFNKLVVIDSTLEDSR